MVIKKLGLGISVFALSLFVCDRAYAKAFCEMSGEDTQRALSEDITTRLAFSNPQGPLNFGLCWWHSRFQRSAVSLIAFRPDRPRPDVALLRRAFDNREAGVLISAQNAQRLKTWEQAIDLIVDNRRVVEIPGYSYILTFSKDFSFLIIKRLGLWQLREGILQFGWVEGITGSGELSAPKFKATLDKLYIQVAQLKRVAYLKIRVPSGGLKLGGHSWLVPKMERTNTGYVFWAIDSNSPTRTAKYEYQFGDDTRQFLARASAHRAWSDKDGIFSVISGAPHLEYIDESVAIERVRAAYCKKRSQP